MKKTVLIILLLGYYSINLYSQELNIGFETGIGSYTMKDLKEVNNINLASLPFTAKTTANFPAYYYYKPSILFPVSPVLSIGAAWSYHSTGSRISLVDYSGEYTFDTKIGSSSPALLAEFFYRFSIFRIAFGNEVGIGYSKATFNELLRVGSQTEKTSFVFKSRNVYYEPALKLGCPVSAFRVDLIIAYHIDLTNGNLSRSDNSKINIQLSGNRLAQADWSGVRLGASLSCNILKRQKSKTDTSSTNLLQ